MEENEIATTVKTTVEALFFSPPTEIKNKLTKGQRYHLLTELQWNYFNGQKSIQLLVKDLKTV